MKDKVDSPLVFNQCTDEELFLLSVHGKTQDIRDGAAEEIRYRHENIVHARIEARQQ